MSVLFAVILGLIISNCFKVPEWLKPAIQSEFYIKIGIVCLGATVLSSFACKDIYKKPPQDICRGISMIKNLQFQ